MAANRVVNVTEFKAKCLAFFAEVEVGKSSFTVTRRGKTVAEVGPPKTAGFKSPRGSWAGKVEIAGDIVNTNVEWDPSRQDPARQ
jgi:antitoxin (DNA-binding transcriptional repressor) of toxin-antitoxin stability system